MLDIFFPDIEENWLIFYKYCARRKKVLAKKKLKKNWLIFFIDTQI